jgi:hypothetical protein
MLGHRLADSTLAALPGAPAATFRPRAASHHHDSPHTLFSARGIVMDLAAAVMLSSIVLYMLLQVEDLVA